MGDILLKSVHCRAAVKPCKACKGGWNGKDIGQKKKPHKATKRAIYGGQKEKPPTAGGGIFLFDTGGDCIQICGTLYIVPVSISGGNIGTGGGNETGYTHFIPLFGGVQLSKTGGGLVHSIPVNDTSNGGTGTGILYSVEDIGTGGGIVFIIYGGIIYGFIKGGIFGALHVFCTACGPVNISGVDVSPVVNTSNVGAGGTAHYNYQIAAAVFF